MSQAKNGARHVFGVLLALERDHLLLPNVAVLEVGNPYEVVPGPGQAPWFCGSRDFEARAVPVVDVEALNSGQAGGTRRARPIFVQTFGLHLQVPAIALLSRGHPHLVDIDEGALQWEPLHDGDRDDLVLCRARLGNTSVLIPDLGVIEAELARAGVAAR